MYDQQLGSNTYSGADHVCVYICACVWRMCMCVFRPGDQISPSLLAKTPRQECSLTPLTSRDDLGVSTTYITYVQTYLRNLSSYVCTCTSSTYSVRLALILPSSLL